MTVAMQVDVNARYLELLRRKLFDSGARIREPSSVLAAVCIAFVIAQGIYPFLTDLPGNGYGVIAILLVSPLIMAYLFVKLIPAEAEHWALAKRIVDERRRLGDLPSASKVTRWRRFLDVIAAARRWQEQFKN